MGYELTAQQRAALDFVGREPEFRQFYLSGGTALAAYYLHHRVSDDLDFFTAEAVDGATVDAAVLRFKKAIGAARLDYQRIHDRRLYVFGFAGEPSPLKIEFTHYPFAPLEPHAIIEGIRIDSERDIAANKLMALIDRFDPKDFVDLYFLMERRPLSEIRVDAERKFGVRISPLTLGAELMKVDRAVALPRLLKPLDIARLKEAVHEAARELKDEIV